VAAQALFAGLVFGAAGAPAATAHVGAEPQYVISEDGFNWHVPSASIDRAVLVALREQISQHKDLVSSSTLQLLGKDDLFTKALVDSSLRNLDQHFEQLLAAGLPPAARQWLGMLGFRIVVNHRGEILRIDQPGTSAPDSA
jgi:hypothetical protein